LSSVVLKGEKLVQGSIQVTLTEGEDSVQLTALQS
jgi:hypothetical protein